MREKIKYFIRILAIKFYDSTEHYVCPPELFKRISLNCKNKQELCTIKEEVRELKSKYPYERCFLKATTIIEQMLGNYNGRD